MGKIKYHLFFLFLVRMASANEVAKVHILKGQAFVLSKSEQRKIANVGSLKEGERIWTEAASEVKLSLNPQTTLVLGPETALAVLPGEISIFSGRLQIESQSELKIKNPNFKGMIRGQAELTLYSDRVRVFNQSGTSRFWHVLLPQQIRQIPPHTFSEYIFGSSHFHWSDPRQHPRMPGFPHQERGIANIDQELEKKSYEQEKQYLLRKMKGFRNED